MCITPSFVFLAEVVLIVVTLMVYGGGVFSMMVVLWVLALVTLIVCAGGGMVGMVQTVYVDDPADVLKVNRIDDTNISRENHVDDPADVSRENHIDDTIDVSRVNHVDDTNGSRVNCIDDTIDISQGCESYVSLKLVSCPVLCILMRTEKRTEQYLGLYILIGPRQELAREYVELRRDRWTRDERVGRGM